jgi:hypothetical protein
VPDEERPQQDPRGQNDAVQESLREQRPGGDEGGNLALAHRLDAQEVAAAGGNDVVGAAADGDRGEELAGGACVARASQEIAPAQRHEDDVREDQPDRSEKRPRRKRGHFAPCLAEIDLAQEEPEESAGRG